MQSAMSEVFRWYSARGTKTISHKDISVWRSELKPAFESMREMDLLKHTERGFELTKLGLKMLNESKAGKL